MHTCADEDVYYKDINATLKIVRRILHKHEVRLVFNALLSLTICCA